VPDSPDSSDAVVLVPPLRGRLADRSLLRWLSQGLLEQLDAPVDALAQVLRALGREIPGDGLAALRMWGQTGERPATWVAAAEAVYLEPRLDRLFLHVLGPDDVTGAELRSLFDALQDSLGADGALGFVRLGGCGYVRSARPMVTPAKPAVLLDGQNPDGALPPAATAAETLNLISEIEMTLHSQPVNADRVARGQPPVNSLWIWGGGQAPEARNATVPPLFGGEALLRGYWASVSGSVRDWPGDIGACLDATPGGFVAAVPPVSGEGAAANGELAALRDALRSGRLDRVILISADGIRATLRGADRLRFWRRAAALLEAPAA
jgi:hypothetical protein